MRTVLETLRDHAMTRPEAPALRGAAETLDFAELLVRAQAAAELLRRRNVRVLALAADNGPDWAVIDFAAQLAEIALVPLPPFFSSEQLRHVLDDSGADAIVVDPLGADQLGELVRGRSEPVAPGLELCARDAIEPRCALPQGTAKISYTSGTTGRPKGVCLSQQSLDRVARSLCHATAEIDIARHLCVLPLATLLENVAGLYAPLLRGAEVVLPSLRTAGFDGAARLDVRRLIANIDRHDAKSVILLPQMLAAMIKEIGAQPGRSPRSLRFVAVGGGCVAKSLLDRADRLSLPVYEGYGLTECGSVVALNTPAARRRGSVGHPLDHIAIHVGADSEVLVRGAAMLGYVGGGEAAPKVVATGDLGHLDADGFLYIDGRRKNVFITSFGRNVSPDWLEAGLVAQTPIAQAAVFGEARPWNTAVIVPAATAVRRVSLQSSIDAVNRTLPDYARVDQWILAAEPFTLANGLLTQNGRNRREAIWNRYAERINAVYEIDRACTA